MQSLWRTGSARFILLYPPGHVHSPIPLFERARAASRQTRSRAIRTCPGIDLRESAQLALLDRFSKYFDEASFPEQPSPSSRYYYKNTFFGCGDALILYAFLRDVQPRRIIEIGTGFSSSAMLDVAERYLRHPVAFTFIDPHPERLLGLLRPDERDRYTILKKPVQDVPIEIFSTLMAGDILFIDSSHVVKAGSDVAHVLFHVLPRLHRGVLIHIHDVYWPFEYPESWVVEGRAWNEAYFLRAFLQSNDTFEILYFNDFVAVHHAEALKALIPLAMNDPGNSLWLRKKAS